jgi:hypothetical protein
MVDHNKGLKKMVIRGAKFFAFKFALLLAAFFFSVAMIKPSKERRPASAKSEKSVEKPKKKLPLKTPFVL